MLIVRSFKLVAGHERVPANCLFTQCCPDDLTERNDPERLVLPALEAILPGNPEGSMVGTRNDRSGGTGVPICLFLASILSLILSLGGCAGYDVPSAREGVGRATSASVMWPVMPLLVFHSPHAREVAGSPRARRCCARESSAEFAAA